MTQFNCPNHFICVACEKCHSCGELDTSRPELCEDCGLTSELCECHSSEVLTPEQQTNDDELDRLVAVASVPTLADLIRRGILSGDIKPVAEYQQKV